MQSNRFNLAHLKNRISTAPSTCRQVLLPAVATAVGVLSSLLHATVPNGDSSSVELTATVVDWKQTTADINLLANRYASPSVSVAVIQNGRIIYAEALGYQDLGQEIPATTATQYGIGSIVKSFTSGLVGSLIGDGLLELNDSPATHVEGLSFRSPDLTQHLRLSHLLTQTSGLPFMDGTLAFFPEQNQLDLATRIPHFEASCRVGDCWSYNNLNFVILDMVVEAVTQQSKSELLDERLLIPAGLEETLSSTSAFKASPNAATGYGMVGDQAQAASTEYLYDEHIYTTARDLARWLDVWMSDGGGIISPDYARAAIATHAIENGAAPGPDEPGIYLFGYGYGWQTQSLEGNYVVRHGGNENGFTAHAAFIPAQNLGLVTLTNQQNSILPNIVNDFLMRRLLGLEAPDISSYPVVVNDVAKLITPRDARQAWRESSALEMAELELVGVYRAEGYGLVKVELRDQTLVLITPAADFILIPRGDNRFGLASTSPVPLGIVIDFFQVEFEVNTLTMNIAAEPVIFNEIEPETVRP